MRAGAIVVAGLLAVLVTSMASGAGPDLKNTGQFSIWTWDSKHEDYKKEFMATHPEIKNVEMVPVSGSDYYTKVQAAVAADSPLGDVILGEISYRARLFQLDILQNLEETPFNLKKSDFLSYTYPVTSFNGNTVAVDENINSTGLAYKTNVAQKYLGTSDVDKLQKRFSTWDGIIDAGKEIYSKSGGKAFFFCTWQDLGGYLNNYGSDAWTKDNKLTPYFVGTLLPKRYQLLQKMIAGHTFDPDVPDAWTPAMSNAVGDDNHLATFIPTWGSTSILLPGDKNGAGRWRLLDPPDGSIYWGGLTFSIWKGSPNKLAAWSFLKWTFASVQGSTIVANKIERFPPFIPFLKSYDLNHYPNTFFAPQKVGGLYLGTLAEHLQMKVPEFYFTEEIAAFKVAETAVIQNPAMTFDSYKKILFQELKNTAPRLRME